MAKILLKLIRTLIGGSWKSSKRELIKNTRKKNGQEKVLINYYHQ